MSTKDYHKPGYWKKWYWNKGGKAKVKASIKKRQLKSLVNYDTKREVRKGHSVGLSNEECGI